MKYRLISTITAMLLGMAATGNTCNAVDDSGPPIRTTLGTPGAPNLEPYQPLHNGAFSGPAVPLSPDPLVRYRWENPTTTDNLQHYLLRTMSAVTATPNA